MQPKSPFGLAPMAGFSDRAMRLLSRRYGCGWQITEMVSAKALVYHNKKTAGLLNTAGEEDPISVQIFGSEPAIMGQGAALAVAAGAQAIDINMGCPVPKVAGHGEGAGLLKNPDQAVAVARAVVRAVDVPVSVKIRLGWDKPLDDLEAFAAGLEGAGVSLITVHGRTRQAYYSGQADWAAIRRVVEAVTIPVYANGDVLTPADGPAILEATGAAGALVGRGALGRPWFFAQLAAAYAGDPIPPDPGPADRADLILAHARLAIEDKGEDIAMRELRKVLGHYVKGLPGAGHFRGQLAQVSTYAGLKDLVATWRLLQAEA
ncbi:tRNA dihydrouridine synthase DusB [Peptococcus simiae]|uniref:tRNA dihydrouridine synthase DusB n=1 Tax=Peptococcus simiae TaxID=1643805 RepID=UPI00397F6AEF